MQKPQKQQQSSSLNNEVDVARTAIDTAVRSHPGKIEGDNLSHGRTIHSVSQRRHKTASEGCEHERKLQSLRTKTANRSRLMPLRSWGEHWATKSLRTAITRFVHTELPTCGKRSGSLIDDLMLGKMPWPLKQKAIPPIMRGSWDTFNHVVAAPAGNAPVAKVERTCTAA